MSDPSILASDPARSVWVAANAGAGKTYTLANRVARLLLADVKPQRILCLTFTKAAAAEMQDRLFWQLGEWAMLDDALLSQKIVAIGGTTEDLRRARRLFAQALETPGGLKILTIHAFCQTVLSRFPLEAGIAPAFEVLDEQSARTLAAEARAQVLEQAGSGDASLAAAISYLVNETSEARLEQIMEAGLGTDRRKLDRFFAGLQNAEDMVDVVRRGHGVGPMQTPNSIAENFCAELARDIAVLRDIAAWLAGGGKTDKDNSARITALIADEFSPASFSHLEALFLTQKGEKIKKLASAALVKARGDFAAYLDDVQQRFCEAHDQYRAARAAGLTEAALTLLAAARAEYAHAKRVRGVLDYDDLIAETQTLLEKKGAAAWVLYKLDNGIDHVLVDEAQDTSPAQWSILKRLTEEFFAGEGRSKVTRTLFAVGDEKQSIFSFQGADPAQFDIHRRHFKNLAEGAGHSFLDQKLLTSRRSAPEILRFVDAVFESAAAREGLTSDGAVLEHRAFRETAPGGIELWPPLKPEDAKEFDIYRPVDAIPPESPVIALAAKIATRIKFWLDSGAALPGHDQAIRPRDIMILLPRREPFGGEVIRQLELRKVPVAGADRVVLTDQMAVMDLMALGHFCIQREDDLTLAALLRSPLCGLSEEQLYEIAQGRRADLWSALAAAKNRKEFAPAHTFLSEMMALADYAPPFEFYSYALGARAGKAALLSRLGMDAADAIDEFLSLTLVYERGGTPSLESFLDWLARGGTEIKRDMERGRDEVRVMTVHGAKGLEADIVILPDTTTLPRALAGGGSLLYGENSVLFALSEAEAPEQVKKAKRNAEDEALKEHRRLFYVALTRARDRLIVCGFENRRGTKDGSWYRLAEEAAGRLGVKLADEEGLGFGTLAMTLGEREKVGDTQVPLPDWIARPAPAEPASPRLIRPSDAVDVSPAPSPRGTGATRFLRGNVIHALLARLPGLPRADWTLKARSYALARNIAADDVDALAREVIAVLNDPAFAAAFGHSSRAEAELLAELPELGTGARIHGRIDRLAVSDDEVLILDFKTNRPPPADETMVSPVILRQIALYRAGATRIFPGKRIICGLLFTDGPRLLRLSDAILERQWADLARRLDPEDERS